MKKIGAWILVLVCIVCLFGCGRFGYAGGPYYFTGKIISENEFGCFVEVIDYGNCDFSSKQVILGDNEISLQNSVGDYLLVEFDGLFLERNPPQLKAFTASKVDAP